MKRILAFVTLSSLVILSCKNSDSSLKDDNEPTIAYYIGQQDGSGQLDHMVLASAPSDADSLSFCLLDQNKQCAAGTAIAGVLRASFTNGKKVFQAQSPLKIDAGLSYEIIALKGQSEVGKTQIDLNALKSLPNFLKAVLVTTSHLDDKNVAQVFWDHARKEFKKLIQFYGIKNESLRELTSNPQEQSQNVPAPTLESLEAAIKALNLGDKDQCLIYLSGHTAITMYGKGEVTPEQFSQMLDRSCGERDTVVLLSGGFAGKYLSNPSPKNNRIILAASSNGAASGLATPRDYSIWDECLFTSFNKVETWQGLHNEIKSCVEKQETILPVESDPQGFFGDKVKDLKIYSEIATPQPPLPAPPPLKPDTIAGEKVFKSNCAGCHANEKSKAGATENRIRMAISSVPNMASLKNLSPADIALISAFLMAVSP